MIVHCNESMISDRAYILITLLWAIVGVFGSLVSVHISFELGTVIIYGPIVYFGIFHELYQVETVMVALHGTIHYLWPFFNEIHGYSPFDYDQTVDIAMHTIVSFYCMCQMESKSVSVGWDAVLSYTNYVSFLLCIEATLCVYFFSSSRVARYVYFDLWVAFWGPSVSSALFVSSQLSKCNFVKHQINSQYQSTMIYVTMMFFTFAIYYVLDNCSHEICLAFLSKYRFFELFFIEAVFISQCDQILHRLFAI